MRDRGTGGSCRGAEERGRRVGWVGQGEPADAARAAAFTAESQRGGPRGGAGRGVTARGRTAVAGSGAGPDPFDSDPPRGVREPLDP